MIEQMKKAVRKNYKKLFIMLGVAIVICLGFCVPYIVYSHIKPIELNSLRDDVDWDEMLDTEEYDKLNGKIVTVDVRYVLDRYYKKTSSTSSTNVVGYGYLIYDEESGYMLGIYSDAADGRKIWSKQADDTYNYLTDSTDKKPKSVTVTGKFRKMTGSELNNFKKTAGEWASDLFDADYRDCTLMYTIDSDVNFFFMSESLIFPIVMIVMFAIILLIVFISYTTGSSVKKIKKFAKKNNLDMAELERDFATASNVGKVSTWATASIILVGNKFTFSMEGTKWKVFKNNDLVWVYYTRINSRYSVNSYRLTAIHYDKKVSYISLAGKQAEECMQQAVECYSQRLPRTIVGYSNDLSKEFRKDYDRFLSHKYNSYSE